VHSTRRHRGLAGQHRGRWPDPLVEVQGHSSTRPPTPSPHSAALAHAPWGRAAARNPVRGRGAERRSADPGHRQARHGAVTACRA